MEDDERQQLLIETPACVPESRSSSKLSTPSSAASSAPRAKRSIPHCCSCSTPAAQKEALAAYPQPPDRRLKFPTHHVSHQAVPRPAHPRSPPVSVQILEPAEVLADTVSRRSIGQETGEQLHYQRAVTSTASAPSVPICLDRRRANRT